MRANFAKQKCTIASAKPNNSKPLPKVRHDKTKFMANHIEEHKEVSTLSARLNFNYTKENERQTMEEIKTNRATDK